MKKIGMIALVMLVAGAALFANGMREDAPRAAVAGYGRISGEEVVVEGTVDVTEAGVILKTADGEYSLSTQRGALIDVESYDDGTALVTGVLLDCGAADCDYDGHIMVFGAEVDGEAIDLDSVQPYAGMGYGQSDDRGNGNYANAQQSRQAGTADRGTGYNAAGSRAMGQNSSKGGSRNTNGFDGRQAGNSRTMGQNSMRGNSQAARGLAECQAL